MIWSRFGVGVFLFGVTPNALQIAIWSFRENIWRKVFFVLEEHLE